MCFLGVKELLDKIYPGTRYINSLKFCYTLISVSPRPHVSVSIICSKHLDNRYYGHGNAVSIQIKSHLSVFA